MNILLFIKLFIFLIIHISFVKGAVELQYVEEGILRKDGQCDIIFTNFGLDKEIKNLVITKSDEDNGKFSITIEGLINGNLGPNQQIYNTADEIKDYIKISQDGNDSITYSIPEIDQDKGTFTLKIDNLTTCEDLNIKQTYIEDYISVVYFLYYENVVPENINQQFDTSKFGPDPNYPFDEVHWDINKGLDDLRETCGIYIKYDRLVTTNKLHWQYYLSVMNGNTKNCSIAQFFEVVKRNFIDFEKVTNLLGENYVGYVLKREGHKDEHLDGVIVNSKYLIEMNEKKCNTVSENQTICTKSLNTTISFKDFSNWVVGDCLNIPLPEEQLSWDINNNSASTELEDQFITIISSDKGNLPNNEEGDIGFETFSSTAQTVYVGRFEL